MRGTWESGQKVTKLIGFDATEDHRTYAAGNKLSVCPQPDLPPFGERYVNDYPLRRWGLDRKACGKIIVNAGLPLPPKSACFFCPAMKVAEIVDLQDEDPKYLKLALEMERLYREGKHFRGDNAYTVTAEHRLTGESEKIDFIANSVDDARKQFRASYDDTERPYKYKVGVSRAVPGLGRTFAWQDTLGGNKTLSRLSLPLLGNS